MMSEHNTWDRSSMPAPHSLLPFKSTSEQIRGLIVPKPTAPNCEEISNLMALPDNGSAANAENENGRFQSSAMGNGVKLSKEDKPLIINGQSSSVSLGNAHELWRRPIKKLKCASRISCNSPGQLQEEEEEEEGVEEEGGESACLTPTAREQRIPQESLVCPPPPCKKSRSITLNCKRKRLSYRDHTAKPTHDAHAYLHILAADQHPHVQVVVSPPDLHRFPECIRALFLP